MLKSVDEQSWSELDQRWPLSPGETAQRTDLFRDSFPEQRACARDPARLKAVLCTRRAAKTFTWGLEALDDSYAWPTGNYLFLGLVREEARRIFWGAVLKALNTKHGLGMRFNEQRLEARMPNGATFYVGAADANEEEMRKLLGQKYRKVCIDEAQDWRRVDLEQLVFHVLKPACADQNGSITVQGTCGLVSVGLLRDLTPSSVEAGKRGERNPKAAGWSVHCWDTFANTARMEDGRTMAEHWAQEIAELEAMKPGIRQTPWFRRNYLGEWVVDEDALVYRYQEGRNDFGELPRYRLGSWHYVLGCDLGQHTALGVHAYHDHDPNFYTLRSKRFEGIDLTSTAEQAKKLDREFGFERWVIDGAAKQSVEEMRRRQDCPWQAADKTDKAMFIELHNTDMLLGRVKHNPEGCVDLIGEQKTLIWDQKKLREHGVKEEKFGLPNHCCDETLYAWRWCYPYLSTKHPADTPRPGSPEWHAQHQERIAVENDRVVEEMMKRQQRMEDERQENEWL